jgi:hypothetical protein
VPRWAGPPPLLIAVTVLGILIAPAVSSAEDGGDPAGGERAVLTTADALSPTPTPTPDLPTPTPTPEVPTTVAPERRAEEPAARVEVVEPRSVGVATFNHYNALTTEEQLADALALTSRPAVSVVGWQEGYTSGPVYQALAERGWATRRYVAKMGMRELAVSWRRAEFTLVDSSIHRLADGVGDADGLYPFGDRYGLRVTLRDRASGELLTVINTHLPQRIEDLERPGTWRSTKNARRAFNQLERLAEIWGRSPGRWVVGTGDYNIAALADMRARNRGGVARAYADVARSSYSLLGFDGLEATHPTSGRYIDYVHVSRRELRSGRVTPLGQRTIDGLASDHRPLLVRLRLS